ncbi:MAG TPA: hypothetical protein VGD81_01805 [Opitutaceae bacterium]
MKALCSFLLRGRAALLWSVAASSSAVLLLASSDAPDPEAPEPPAPLFEGLGSWQHPVETQHALAQRYFNQGLMFIYGFNHKEAIRAFEASAKLDPELAMAWWGVAFAHGPNINAPMAGDAVPPAWTALQNALRLKTQASPRHQAYIDALATRYASEPKPDRAALDATYAEAMRRVTEMYPDDLDAAVLYADAVMNTMAWDYWLADRRTAKPATLEIMRKIEDVLARRPDHPGANHAYIHLVEAGPEPFRALPSADRLQFYAPDAGHLVHMPSHIYIRTGRYHEATLANERAAAADRAYIAQCQAQGFYPGMYYPHNLHFIWYALSFEGRADECIRAAMQVADYATSPLCGTDVAEAPRLRHLPWLAQARFGRWDELLALAEPPEDRPLDRAMWHYVRTLAFAAKNDADAAARESVALDKIVADGAIKPLDNPYLPASSIVQVAQHVAAARVSGARGDHEAMITALRSAVEAEHALPYMEPAFWYYPTRQSLGAALLKLGRAEEAAKVFREDLLEFPRNGWSLYGLTAAMQAQGRPDDAALLQREFAAAWPHADRAPDLSWF